MQRRAGLLNPDRYRVSQDAVDGENNLYVPAADQASRQRANVHLIEADEDSMTHGSKDRRWLAPNGRRHLLGKAANPGTEKQQEDLRALRAQVKSSAARSGCW